MNHHPVRLLAAVAALLVLSGCGLDLSTGDKGYIAGEGTVRQYDVGKRPQAPAISGTTLEGEPVTVSTLAAGRPTVLNVWGQWCADCRKESPVLNAAAKRLGSRASFVGINVRDAGAKDAALAFQRRFGVPYPSIYDPTGRSLLGMPKSVTIYAVPSTIVLDGQGRVAATVIGAVPSALTLEELVKSATS